MSTTHTKPKWEAIPAGSFRTVNLNTKSPQAGGILFLAEEAQAPDGTQVVIKRQGHPDILREIQAKQKITAQWMSLDEFLQGEFDPKKEHRFILYPSDDASTVFDKPVATEIIVPGAKITKEQRRLRCRQASFSAENRASFGVAARAAKQAYR